MAMTPNASRPVWSTSRGCWLALHRESGGNLWLMKCARAERGWGMAAFWIYIRDAEEYDMPLFKDAMIEQTNPAKEE